MRSWTALATVLLGAGAACVLGVLGATTGHHRPWLAIAFGAILAVTMAATIWAGLRHRALVRDLRRASAPTEWVGIQVRTGELGDAAFVAGLGRPTIYCDSGLPGELTDEELRAVLLHERAHQRALDPVRLLVVGLVAPLARRSESGSQWLAWTIAQREIAADRYAMSHGASRRELASALLKLPPLTHAHVPGFTTAIDLRLEALVGGGDPAGRSCQRPYRATLVAAAASGAAMCAWFLHHGMVAAFGLVCC